MGIRIVWGDERPSSILGSPTDITNRKVYANAIVSELTEVVAKVLDQSSDRVGVATVDIPSKWNMEGGELLPEPGEAYLLAVAVFSVLHTAPQSSWLEGGWR